MIVKVGGKELGLSHHLSVTAEETDRKERQMEWGERWRSTKISLATTDAVFTRYSQTVCTSTNILLKL